MEEGTALPTAVCLPQPLRDYAFLADGERGALVGPRGEYAWMCVPHWDSEAVFSTLVGGSGVYAITPAGRYVWGGYYEEGTLIWRSRWVTESGILECREALAFPGDPHRAVVLRRVTAHDGPAEVRVSLEPRAGFGDEPFTGLHRDEAGVWTARSGRWRLRWLGGGSASPTGRYGQRLDMGLRLEAGESHDFVLEVSDRPLEGPPPDAAREWSATESAWAETVPRLDRSIAPGYARTSYAVLRGMTSSGGGTVAAASTSLPERAEEGRNYDYRYVWIRDQCITGQAVAAAGDHRLLDGAVRFVTARLHEDGDRLAPAYTTDGGPIPDQHPVELPGYPGGFDLVGNRVADQFQLDVFGEALLLLASAAALDQLGDDGWRAAGTAADAIARRWTEPDAGVWELDAKPWAHSRLICAAGLRAMAGVARARARGAEWLALADRLVADTAARSLHPDGHWQRAPDDPRLDGALLLPGIRGAVPVDDPRTRATLRRYTAELTDDFFAYRFRQDERPLAEAEGAFLLCGFTVALAEHQQGNPVEAHRWFERNRAASGPPGLFSEEFDVGQRQMRGNLPQSFVHALMLESSIRLGDH